jgi:RNA polymerase sigma-70 factor
MSQMPGLAATFLAHTKVRFGPPADAAALEGLLARTWEDSRAQWPSVALPAEVFVAHLAERLPEASPSSPLEPLLAQLSHKELYLACACLRGMPSAIALFEQHYLAKMPGLLRGPKYSAALIDDACQLARVKLLVHDPEGGPKLAEYSGRGTLMGWVRVTTVRIAARLRSAVTPVPDESPDDIIQGLPAPDLDPELDAIRMRYREEYNQALRDAFSSLSADERHLLRLSFEEQLSTYELAPLFRVHQSTISRWLTSALDTVYEDAKRRLQERLGLSTHDFTSLLAVLRSQLNLSISQLLGEEDGAPRTPGHG